MKNLLRSELGDTVFVEKTPYVITKKSEFMINNSKAYRWTLFNELQTIFVEVKREFALNYLVFKYSLVESIAHDKNFLSILGTSTLGYKNPKISKNEIFKKVKMKQDRYDLFKHVVLEEDLPEDFLSRGYRKDGYGNYYYFTKRYYPQIKKAQNNEKIFWEYKQENNTRLLIETKKDAKDKIFIYKGKELSIKDISLSNSPVVYHDGVQRIHNLLNY